MNQTKWFNAEQSESYGLVNRVTSDLLPAGVGYTAIYEDGSVLSYPASVPGKLPPNLADLLGGMKFPTAAPGPN
jgi:hypothetical protein